MALLVTVTVICSPRVFKSTGVFGSARSIMMRPSPFSPRRKSIFFIFVLLGFIDEPAIFVDLGILVVDEPPKVTTTSFPSTTVL